MKNLLTILAIAALPLGGCGKVTLGGSLKPTDLSSSVYAYDIRKTADDLVTKGDPNSLQAAAELYATIGELDRMDSAATEFLKKDPRRAAPTLKYCDLVRKHYEKNQRR